MTPIYMVIGCPGSGKSWVCEQLREQYEYVRHDDHMAKNANAYLEAIRRAAATSTKPLLIETPFSVSQIKEPLEAKGFHVHPVFIQELPDVLRRRYRERGSGELPEGHLTRQATYATRARDWQAYQGTSAEVFRYLRSVGPRKQWPWE